MITYKNTLTCCALACLALNHSPNHLFNFGCCSLSGMSRSVLDSHALRCQTGPRITVQNPHYIHWFICQARRCGCTRMITYKNTLTCCVHPRLVLINSSNHLFNVVEVCCSCSSGLSDFDVVVNQKVFDLANGVFTAMKQTGSQHSICPGVDCIKKILWPFGAA